MRRLLKPLWILLALVFLFEAWLWHHLSGAIRRAVDVIPWHRLKARIAAAIESLPPLATLFVFLVPVILLLPIKFLGLWMLAHGYWLGALGVLGLAKAVSLGVTAFIFDLTRPKLLELAWFRRLYEHVLSWLARAHALIDPIKHEVREWMAPIRRRLKSWFWLTRPRRAGRFLKRLARIRRRMQAQPQSTA